MNLDLDSGGALVTAALVAHEVEPGPKNAAAAEQAHDHACANCGATLTGPYCHRCGQSAHVHRSLLHLGEEFLHGLLHFDAKAWRTLPLLVIQPGRLTRNYIDGKRTRYVSPLALFLFMVFLMFFVVSSVTHFGDTHIGNPLDAKGVPAARNTIAADVAKARGALDRAEASLATMDASSAQFKVAVAAVNKARLQLEDAESAKTVVDSVGEAGEYGDGSFDKAVDKVADKLRKKESRIDTGIPSVDKALKIALDNPQLTLYKLKSSASKFSFLLVPLSLPFLWLMFFWKKDVTMYDHGVFSLYALSFMALLVITVALLGMAGLSTVAGNLLWIAPPIHMFMQLRGAYRLRKFSALWRTAVLLVVSLCVLILYLVLILTVSVAM